MRKTYKPSGVCAREIEFDIDENKHIHNLRFIGGCAGNLQGISNLVEGMTAEDAIKNLRGINCRNGTSCPDQFAKALESMLKTVINE